MSTLWDVRTIEPRREALLAGDTLPALFWDGVRQRGPKVWFRQKDRGIWKAWTWTQIGEAVREVANGLLALEFKEQSCGSILSNTIVEWMLADLAVLSCRGVANGIYPTDTAPQVHYICEDSSTTLLFVENEEQLDKALQVRDRLPLLRWIVVFDMKGLRTFSDPMVISFDALRQKGREYAQSHPDAFEQRLSSCTPEDLGILVYTSGTTGKPKGAMNRHDGLMHSVRMAADAMPQGETDERMAFLPLCHIAERMSGAYTAMYTGTVLNFVENPETVPENIQEISPTILFAVPRVWEKFYSAVTIAVNEGTGIQRALYHWAIDVGSKVAERYFSEQPIGWTLRCRFMLARWLALDNVRKLIGIHRARFLFTGAAPISPDLIRWYYALGIPMFEAWGQTESGGLVTMTRPGKLKLRTVGVAVPGAEVKVDPDTGELLVRSPSQFCGYLNQPEKTAETVDAEGWLHTGDIGTVDEEGFFRITDRMKDIIITAGGKNITPSEIENELRFSPYITDAVVIGDRRPYLTSIIMIDQENVEKFAQDQDIPFSNYASLTQAPEVRALIQRELDRVNENFARVEQIKKFHLLNTQLTAEDEELTPTMKLKRNLVQQKYAQEIEAMYAESRS